MPQHTYVTEMPVHIVVIGVNTPFSTMISYWDSLYNTSLPCWPSMVLNMNSVYDAV